jgi:proteasome alpha subunit
MYRIMFDGSIVDERGSAAIGGQAEELKQFLRDKYEPGLSLEGALKLACRALEAAASQKTKAANLEVAVLDRTRPGRKFRRILAPELRSLIGAENDH